MLAVICLSPKPNRFTLSTDPNSLDPCGTRICPREPTGAMVVASTWSPVWEMREPVGVDKRASKVVPAGKSSRAKRERKQNEYRPGN